jgi:hypothetical protein
MFSHGETSLVLGPILPTTHHSSQGTLERECITPLNLISHKGSELSNMDILKKLVWIKFMKIIHYQIMLVPLRWQPLHIFILSL